MEWEIYLSGEIHTNWRGEIIETCRRKKLPVNFSSAVTDHEASDSAGDLLGRVESGFWRDHQSSKVNAIRTKTMIEQSDIAVIKFGDKYKQWNAAFEAGLCAALGKPYITLHAGTLVHPLKEVDATSMAWAETTAQVVGILEYVTTK